jgi:tetratricopeptide (TPR) repeat protein
MAQQIVSHREHHGAFRQLDDLLDVPGVTQFTLGQIQDLLYVEVPEEAPALPAEEYPVSEGEEQLPLELVEARRRLQSGALPLAMEIYANLIAAEQHLSTVIQDLEGASQRYPDDFNVWQSLGDAYFRADSIQEALKAYTKAEQLL